LGNGALQAAGEAVLKQQYPRNADQQVSAQRVLTRFMTSGGSVCRSSALDRAVLMMAKPAQVWPQFLKVSGNHGGYPRTWVVVIRRDFNRMIPQLTVT